MPAQKLYKLYSHLISLLLEDDVCRDDIKIFSQMFFLAVKCVLEI